MSLVCFDALYNKLRSMDNNNSHSNDFGGTLPLPEGDQASKEQSVDSTNAAAELIRKKVSAAYADEPDAQSEIAEVESEDGDTPRSKHQQFIYDLTSSGKSLEDIQVAWHEYYAGLSDIEKHQVWQEFYSVHSKNSHFPVGAPSLSPDSKKAQSTKIETLPVHQPKIQKTANSPSTLDEIRGSAVATLKSLRGVSPKEHLHSLLFGLGTGAIVLVIFLFSFFNERFIAPFIQPSRTISGTPIIGDGAAINNNPEVIIPKINVEIPVVYGVDTVDDNAVENALESGVVHYADTAMPGQNGNLVIVGHSSNNIFNKGKYKFAFVLLSRLENGDTFYIQKDGKRYTYQVYKKTIVPPTDVTVLGPADKEATATLITCDPPGTSTNRLVVVGQQISPDPIANKPSNGANTIATSTRVVPGNSTSLWSRITHSL